MNIEKIKDEFPNKLKMPIGLKGLILFRPFKNNKQTISRTQIAQLFEGGSKRLKISEIFGTSMVF